MESTAQYWRPVWETLERDWQPRRRQREGAGPMSGTLHLAQAQSNQGPRGRKKDFPDAERLVKRLVAQELTLSFVPEAEQRLWRTVMRRKYQVTRNRVQLQNRLECLLEEAHIKVSSLVSDLLGASARRMLQALADGETNPATLAALASRRLRATPDQLCDALGACTDLHPVYRRLLQLMLEELRVIEDHIAQLDQEMAGLLSPHQPAVQRLAAVPGLGVDSAQQIIAEVGADGRDLSVAQASRLVGGRLPRRRGERGRQLQPSLAERQSADAPLAESGRQCRRQDERQYLRAGLSPTGAAARPRTNDRRDCASSLSSDLEDSAPGRLVRGTRTGRRPKTARNAAPPR